MMETGRDSFLSQFPMTKAENGSDCTNSSIIIAQTGYIPENFKLSSIVEFMQEVPYLFVAIERIPKENSVIIGLPDRSLTPQFATQFLCFLVMSRIRPELWISAAESYEMKDFLEDTRPHNVELHVPVIEDPPPAPPPDHSPVPEKRSSPDEWGQLWCGIKHAEWESTRREVSFCWANEIEANLDLFRSRRILYEEPTPLKYSMFRTNNFYLGIPNVDEKILESVAAHSGVFDVC